MQLLLPSAPEIGNRVIREPMVAMLFDGGMFFENSSMFMHWKPWCEKEGIVKTALVCIVIMAVFTRGASAISVAESADRIEVDTGQIQFALGTDRKATVRWVQKKGRRLVERNEAPMLSARLMESAVYDGVTDFVPDRRFIDAQYLVDRVDHTADADRFTATLRGRLEFEDGDRLRFEIFLMARTGEAHLDIDVTLSAEGDFHDRFVRDVVLRLPLALDWRKRIAQGGDQGLQWDTRYYYEFPGRMGILPHPDRNEFRYFAVEQDSPHHFRIWRAESHTTPELTHQHGIRAAGWTSVYDASGGVLFAMRDMAEAAPKTLAVDAAGGGEAKVLLYPETAPAFCPVHGPAAEQVFGRRHATTWVFYCGEHPDARPVDLLEELWQADTRLIGQRPEGPNDLWDAELTSWTASSAGDGKAPYVRGGIPLPQGAFPLGTPVALSGPGGAYPVQTMPLAFWPDGSVKWLHLVFALDGALDNALDNASDGGGATPLGEAVETFQVTLRDGPPLDFRLSYGLGDRLEVTTDDLEDGLSENESRRLRQNATRIQSPIVNVAVLETADNGGPGRLRLDTGPLQFELALGPHWMPSATIAGTSVWDQAGEGPVAFVDFFQAAEPYHARTTHPAGQADPGPVVIERLDVEEAGPLRAVVRLQGRALSQQPTDVVLRVEAFANRAQLRLTHTAEFTRHDPRNAFLQGMGLRFPVALAPQTATVTVGGQHGPVPLPADGKVILCQHSPMHYRLVRAEQGQPRLVETQHRAAGWMDVRDGQRGLTLALRDMWQAFPKALEYSPDTGDLTAWLWPACERLMDVRRYSDFPHLAQGESAAADNRWVQTHYYGGRGAPNDPFAGTSRTHELLLEFHADDPDIETIAAIHADFQSPPLVYSGLARYRDTGVTLPLPDFDHFPEISKNLDHFTDFWLFHQRYWNWYGIWDFGDVQHRFRGGGYGWKIAPQTLKAYLDTPPEARGRFGRDARLILDYYPQQDWLFDNGRWGWTNTEGLPGLYFQQEYLRTGRRDVFFMAEALARHARDVVARQSGRFFGTGTRHGVQHWSDGNHEERQTTFAEYRLHYYLSGESRSRDVMMKLSDYYRHLKSNPPRRADHSGRIYGLFTRWEMTGDPAFGALLRDYLHTMIVPDGLWSYADFRLVDDQGRPTDLSEGVNTKNMFFHNFGAMHGVFEVYRATGDEALRAAVVRSARATLQPDDRLQQGSASLGLLAGFAALYARQDDRFRDLILADMSDPGTGSRDAFRMVLPDPKHWTGETASLSRQSPLCWFYMVNLPVIMAAVGQEPQLHDRIWARFNEANDRERPVESGAPFHPRPSWQDEYDDPELSEYFAPWRP